MLQRDIKHLLMPKLLKIVNKEGKLVPFHPSPVHVGMGLGTRNQILKARQMWTSTYFLADYFLDAVLPNEDGSPSNFAAAIYSYNDQATQRLLDRVALFHDQLPDPKPVMSHDSAHLKSFPEMGSRIYISTAGSRVSGIGDTLNKVLLSEYAYWSDESAKRIRSAVEQAVPLGGEIDIENTCNGEGGEFYDMWNDPSSVYRKMFLPWYLHSEYSLPEGSQYALANDRYEIVLTGEEISVMDKYGLTLEQIRWRRMKKAEAKEMFPQWYPEDQVNCFLAAGGSVFESDKLEYLGGETRNPPIVEEDGRLKIWGLPRPGERFTIGVDVADMGNDYCAAFVMSDRFDHRATLWGKWDVSDFAAKVAKLGARFNDALVVPERNGVGLGVITALVNQERYPFLYKVGERIGFVTTKTSKPVLISKMKDVIHNFLLGTHDADFVSELRGFRKNEDGTYGAKSGFHDDIVMAFGLAVEGIDQVPIQSVRKAEKYGWAARGF